MFSRVYSGGICGIEGYIVIVEGDVSDGLPSYNMVGYLSSEVREAGDRVRTAIKNSGYRLQSMKITINLSPADIRKDGTAFDVPIAIAVLTAYGVVSPDYLETSVMLGEMGLDGEIKSVRGVLSIVSAAKDAGIKRCFVPKANIREACVISGIDCIGVSKLAELVDMLNNNELMNSRISHEKITTNSEDTYDVDYSEVNGQKVLKRATEIAVAGRHNILFIGPAGTGKSMIAQRIPTIMPSLSAKENLEISKIYSISGMLSSASPLLSKRPFRSPHHTISTRALTGGGVIPKPGEISLASGGVLFLDEFPEFKKETIEILRQPLEEHKILISRLHGAYEFPANFMLCAAANPCPCGFYPDRSRCTCSEQQVKRYLGKISKPLLDRIDICAETSMMTYDEIEEKEKNETSYTIRSRIEKARMIQEERYKESDINFNSEIRSKDIGSYCRLSEKNKIFMKKIYTAMGLSARGYHKIIKVARTIADLDESEDIRYEHLCEAVSYRSLEAKYFGGQNEQ